MAYDNSDYSNSGDKGEYKEYDLSNPYMDQPSKKKKKESEMSAADRRYFKSLKTRYRGDEHIDFDSWGRRRRGWGWFLFDLLWDIFVRR